MLVIEGREDGRAVLVMKTHHALADGVSFAETFANFFDISPEVSGRRASASTTRQKSRPSRRRSACSFRGGRVSSPAPPTHLRRSRVVGESYSTKSFAPSPAVVVVRGRRHATPDQPSIFEARRTSLNGSAGIEKTFLRTRVPLADAKRAAKAHGATVTDFVMATTSGALKRLLDDRGEELKKDLIAFVPINVRGEGDTSELGNQISGMLLALHTDVVDPPRASALNLYATRKDGRRTTRTPSEDLPR